MFSFKLAYQGKRRCFMFRDENRLGEVRTAETSVEPLRRRERMDFNFAISRSYRTYKGSMRQPC